MEEEEAKAIQKRLISRIDDADIEFDLLTDVVVRTFAIFSFFSEFGKKFIL